MTSFKIVKVSLRPESGLLGSSRQGMTDEHHSLGVQGVAERTKKKLFSAWIPHRKGKGKTGKSVLKPESAA